MTPLAQLAASIARLETLAPLVLDGEGALVVAAEVGHLRRAHVDLTSLLTSYARACANVAAQHERFKALDPFAYHVHPDSLRRIAAAHRPCTHLAKAPLGYTPHCADARRGV